MNTIPLIKLNVITLIIISLSIPFGINDTVQAQATTQTWTGITPAPANGTAFTLSQVQGGTWDATANWANASVGTATDYYALTSGAGRVATFLGKTGGYTVTIADGYTVPIIRALQVAGGDSAAVTIQSNSAKTITLSTNSGAYINVTLGRELKIGANTAIAVSGNGASSFSKIGDGTLRWSGSATTYNHTILLSAGTFIIDSDASSRLGSSATINISGGEFRYNGASALSSVISLNSGKISGTGRIASTVSIGARTVIAPGDSAIGTQHYDNLIFADSGVYQWEIGSWLGTSAGTDFDQIQADSFTASSTLAHPFVISLASVGGALSDFDASVSRSWTLVESANPISSTVLDNFSIDSTAFATLNPLNNGTFSLAVEEGSLNLVFNAVPEPSAILLMSFALILLASIRRRMA